MKLTVFGATGRTGGLVVQQALDVGHQVTAVVRNPDKLTAHGSGLTVAVVPDLADTEALVPLIQGATAVLSGLGPTSPRNTGIAESGTRAIVRAMELTDVRRLITISALPVGPTPEGESFVGRRIAYPLIRRLFAKVYADVGAMEQVMAASALDWTAVRPGNLGNQPFTGRYRHLVAANVPNAGTLGRADLACAMLAFIDDPATVKQVVGLGAAR
ncbi:NAD(P)-dependent oxidoreductase [Streptomyces boninensis]|uniref:NAD(P)-dependent oxidoreductase n=1 Tax=Streptomyces boninensis TaxID=2039455 RepID=UPI003B213192